MITALFYSHILNTDRGSLHARSFRLIHLSTLWYIDNSFACLKSFRGLQEMGLWIRNKKENKTQGTFHNRCLREILEELTSNKELYKRSEVPLVGKKVITASAINFVHLHDLRYHESDFASVHLISCKNWKELGTVITFVYLQFDTIHVYNQQVIYSKRSKRHVF